MVISFTVVILFFRLTWSTWRSLRLTREPSIQTVKSISQLKAMTPVATQYPWTGEQRELSHQSKAK